MQYSFTDPGFVDLSSVDIGDIDGDGVTDIVVTSATNNTVIPIFNVTSDPTRLVIGLAESTATNPTSVLLIDLDATIGDEIAVACAGESVTEGQIHDLGFTWLRLIRRPLEAKGWMYLHIFERIVMCFDVFRRIVTYCDVLRHIVTYCGVS